MTVVKSGPNRVVTKGPKADDTHVRVAWFGPTKTADIGRRSTVRWSKSRTTATLSLGR